MSAEAYDPMIYDTMRETANRLVGKYSRRLDSARDSAQREALRNDIIGVRRWVSGVDADSRQAVLDATNQLRQWCDDQTVIIRAEEFARQLTADRDVWTEREAVYA